VVGTYTPPRGAPAALYSRYDLRFCCEKDHVLKPAGSKICRQCRYEAKYGLSEAAPSEDTTASLSDLKETAA
jgi:hypothetical protein